MNGPFDSSPSRWRSYRHVDATEDPGSFAHQLEQIASVGFVAHEKRRSLELLRLTAGARVLDVGCGTGVDLAALAEAAGPQGHVVGLERSAALLEAARGRGGERAGPVELVQGDACALPFADREFDGCRADRTLQHVEQPEAALAEMVRVTGAGGRVVVSESRWGLVAPALDQALTDRVLGLLASEAAAADWLGHRLPAMFERAGLGEVEAIDADYSALEREELFAFTRLRESVADAAGRGAVDEVQAGGWLGRLDELVSQGEAFAVVVIRHVAGTRQ